MGLQELERPEIEAILDAASFFKSTKKSFPQVLKGKSAALLFSEPSTRTRSSFELALRRLGAEVLSLETNASSILKGETLLDTVLNLEAMGVEYFVVRHGQSGILDPVAAQTKASIINGGDGSREHPTQGLLDLFTLRERKGKLKSLKVVIVGDILHSRVARSNLHALRAFGAKVILCGPPALVPRAFSGLAELSHNLDSALRGADAVNVLRLQLERQKENFVGSMAQYHRTYGLTPRRLALAKPDCIVLHPGPINRGVEIASEVADGPLSVILEQVANGVAVRMAVLSLIQEARNG